MFKGSITALVTPFDADGAIDEDAVVRLVEWQIEEGTRALVPCGTTGEAPALSAEEQRRLIALTVKTARARVPVIAGCGTNATAATIERVRAAEEVGADAALIVAPYYNKPTQAGLFAHFKAVHDACGLPIVIYNIPGRTSVDIAVETLARLAELPRIVAVKDATGRLDRVARQRLACGPDFIQLSGEDTTAVGFNAMGGQGCISVTANVAPRLVAEMQEACLAGDYDRARALQDRLMPLHEALFAETSPAPVKYALHLMGWMRPDPRLPLVVPGEQTRERIREALRRVLDRQAAA
ncbi:MAG: 4-hydroxy-tetrahydrodipicolinate synthase [Alphaproteobacteria bacterium]|nr:MAG: 4-hydroxy-tetrahydrodipicolinate synthase [Alphaproteobacteria bacterium]